MNGNDLEKLEKRIDGLATAINESQKNNDKRIAEISSSISNMLTELRVSEQRFKTRQVECIVKMSELFVREDQFNTRANDFMDQRMRRSSGIAGYIQAVAGVGYFLFMILYLIGVI